MPAVQVPVISGGRRLPEQPKDAPHRADKKRPILTMIAATELPEGEYLTSRPCAARSEKFP
jgi:hypothetical protein